MFRNEGNVRETLRRVGVKNCYISEITVAELYFGLAKADDKKRKMEDIVEVKGCKDLKLETGSKR